MLGAPPSRDLTVGDLNALLKEEKIGRAQIKKCEENFFVGWRGFRATAGLASLSGVFLKKCSNFVQKTPPSFTFSEIERCCLGASRLGMVFFRNFEGIFEIARQRAVGNAEVRTNLFEKIPNPFGIFLLSAFFGLVGFFYEVYGKFEPIIALLPKSGDFFFQILFSENELLFFR